MDKDKKPKWQYTLTDPLLSAASAMLRPLGKNPLDLWTNKMKISYLGMMHMSAPMTLSLAAAAKVSQNFFEDKIGSCSY